MESITLGSRERNKLLSQGSVVVDGIKYITVDKAGKTIMADCNDEGYDCEDKMLYFKSMVNGKYIYTDEAPKQKVKKAYNRKKPSAKPGNWGLSGDELINTINLKYFLGDINSPAEDFETWFKENESELLSKYPGPYEEFMTRRNNTSYSSGGDAEGDYKLNFESKMAEDCFFGIDDVGFVSTMIMDEGKE